MRPINELTLYRYRYLIGYSLLAILCVGLLLLFIDKIPEGLSHAEEASALTSSQVTFNQNFLSATNMVDLPYHLVQKASLKLFGLGTFGVRLPSLIFAAFSMLFLLLILRRWLQENVAIAWGILVATSTWFLMLGRSGTPDIMVVFWTSLILLLATLVSQQSRGYQAWKALALVSIALSFYTPLMAYLFIASALAAMFQPHLRYVIRYAEKTSITLGLVLFIILLIPLAWNVWREPIVLRELLALPATFPGPIAFFQGLGTGIGSIVNPFQYSIGSIITPLLGIPTIAFAAFGLIRTIGDYHSVRSYVLLLWLAVLLPIIGLNPESPHVMFVLVMLLGAIGTQVFFRYWYDLFPRNPYARVFGLIPLALLLGSTINFNYQRYYVGTVYARSSVQLYDPNPLLLHDTLSSKTYRDQRIILVTTPDRKQLYEIDKTIAKNLIVTTPSQYTPSANTNNIIVDTAAESQLTSDQRAALPKTPTNILVTDRKDDALRFRIYTQ